MAKYGSSLAEVKVYINGKEQAKKDLEELKAVAKEYKDQMTLANNAMLEAADKMAEARERANKNSGNKDSAEYKAAVDDELRAQKAHDDAQKRFKENHTEYKKYQRLIGESEKLTVDLETAMNRLSEQDIKHLRLLQRQLDAIRNQIDPKMDKDGSFLAYINNAIKTVADTIKNRKGELVEFEDIIGKITHVDDRTLEGVIKRLKELIATTDKVDTEKLKRYKDELAKAEGEKARRVKVEAQDVQQQVKDNKWKGTIEETEKAIELQRQYMKLLDTTDAAGIKDVEDTIEALQQKLKQAKNELMSYEKAMAEVDKMNKGTWKGTLEDLEKIKKSLEYHKKNKLEVGGDSKGLKDIEKALREIEKTGRGAHMSMKDIDELLKHLDSASIEQLNNAAKELQDQLQDAERGTEEYAKITEKLRNVNLELKKAKKEWEGQENVITRTAKRLMAYVAVYGGFNEIIGKMKEMVQMNLQLSDSMADVQKTTGLSGIELQELGRSLERIDTRTTTAELYQLAAAAGQIGLKTQEDVLGFAKAANTISVALNELGAEGSASLMKVATLTGEVQRYGTEQALTRVGSAINELTANSAATAGPIADFISRVGGIASASKMAIHEMAALGAATDASAQSIEIAGTSMNKFITALVSNTENIAYATNLNVQELQSLINEGNTMQAVVRVLESMQTMDRGGISAAMKELGSEGARMNQYIASIVSNLDMLKAQLALSKNAFEENVSVLNEYNVKQESALGILQRMKNNFMDTFVNSKMTVVLKDILQTIAAIPHWLEQHRTILLGVRVMIASIIAFRIPFLLNALAKNLWGLYGLLSGPFKAAMVSFNASWNAAAVSVTNAGLSINGFTGKLRVLWTVIKANPLGLILTVATAVGTALWHMREETDKVAKATAELTKKHTRQIEELQALQNALEATNTSYAVKAAAMKEINSLYSKYLGFELSELDNYEKKKAALDYINAKLKENQTLEMANRQKEVYSEEFNKDTEKNLEGITEALMSIPEIGAKRLTEAMAVMHKAINEGATTTEEVMKKLSEHFKATIEFDDDEWGFLPNIISFLTDTNLESLESYIEKYSTLQQQLAGTDEYFNGQKLENQRISDEALEKLAIEHQNKIAAITANHQEKLEELQKNGSAITEAEQIAHLQALLKEQEQYQKTAEKMLQRAKEKDEEFIASQTNENQMIDLGNMHAKYGGTETGHIVSSRVRELNDLREQMAKVRRQIAEDEKALNKATEQLRLAEQKENNEEEVQAARATVEEKKKAINDGNEAIIRNEMKWNAKYSELQTWATSDARKKWGDTVEEIGSKIRSLQIQITGDPWGKAFDLKDWKQFPELIEGLEGASVTSLVQGFEKLRDNTKLITQDVDAFNKMFDLKTPLKDLNEVNTQVYRWLAQIRGELKKRGRNTTGAPIFTNAKEELDLVLKNLQTHFLKRQKEIREAYIQGSMTSEEMDRQLAENDRIFVNERIELRKLLLGENSKFMKELYPDLAETNLPKLRLDLEVLGDEVTAELRKDLEEDENLTRESAIKIRKAIEQELIAGDPFGTLRSSFRSSLDQLMLMSSQYERDHAKRLQKTNDGEIKYDPFNIMGLTQEEQEKRLDFLIDLSEKSYMVDRDGLRKVFENHSEYYNWVKNLDDEQMAVMLNKLQWFYDESLIKQSQYKERVLKGLESAYLQQDEKMNDIAKLRWKINKATADRDSLVEQNKAYETGSGPSGVTKQQYDSNIQEIESRNQAIKELEEKLQEELDKASKKRDSKKRENERKAKEDMEASISALQAYYNEMEALIRKQGLENKWTPEDIERKVMANKIAAERDEIELRKKLLGDISTFDPNANNGYKGVITGHEFFGTNKGEAELKKQAEQIKVWGKALIDGMRNQIAKGEIEIATEAEKVREKVKKALLEGDMFGKFENDFSDMLDEIGVLTSEFEDKMNEWHTTVKNSGGPDFGISLSEEERKRRIAALTQFADEAYSLTAESLRDRMAQNTIYANWVNNLNDDEMGILLQKLRGYYDDRLALTKRYQDQMKKGFDAYYQQTGKQAEYEQKKKSIELSNQQQSDLEGFGVTRGVDYGAKRQSISDSFDVENQKYLDQIAKYKEQSEALTKDMVDVMREKGLGSPEYQEMYRQKEAMDQLILDTELERNQLLAQSQRDLTQVYMDEWTKRAERWGQWGEMFGEYLGEQVMLEKQANDARARGDLETAKKIEQQQKQNKQALIQNLLSKIVDEAALWAKEYALKMMFNSLMLAEDKKRAIEEATLQGKSSMLSIFLNALTGQSKEHAKGLPGLVTGAIVFAATMALQAFAKSAIANMFPEAATGSTGTRKLSTGMLTYAKGNYPVLGNDGKVYDAKYEGAGMKTGVYGGGAHFGIFSEKQPEMIVDGKTTQKIILNYPYIYDAITTIAKNGRLKNAMPTFATGDYPAGMKQLAPITTVEASTGNNEQMERTNAVLEQATSVIRELSKVLTSGQISASVDPYANRRATQRAEKFMKRRGID